MKGKGGGGGGGWTDDREQNMQGETHRGKKCRAKDDGREVPSKEKKAVKRKSITSKNDTQESCDVKR